MSKFAEILKNYCDDVVKNKINTNLYTKKAVKRFLNDLKRQNDADFNFEYHQEFADNLCNFAEELKPVDLNGKKLKLLDWQVFILCNLEGWTYKGKARRDEETGILLEEGENRKRFRLAYIEVNRKNGKTSGILEPMVLFNFLKYPASESYLVSSRDDLSEKTFKEIKGIIKADKELDKVLDCRSLAITFKDLSESARLGFFCDGGKDVDGFRPRFFCIDEYHAYLTDKMFTSMQYGTRSKADAQGVVITTADTSTIGPCFELSEKAKRILTGVQNQDDFFSIIFCLDEKDDFKNPNCWIKANPSLNQIIQPDVIQADIDDALNEPAKIPELKAKTFGIWGGGGLKSWISLETWSKNRGEVPKINFNNPPVCFGGLDLATIDDLAAFSFCYSLLEINKTIFNHRFYIPESTIYERYRKEKREFFEWVEKGLIIATPGNTINYEFIIKDILEISEKVKLLALGFDRWQAADVVKKIDEKKPDLQLVEIEQSLKKLSPITKSYEKAIREGKIIDNNPVMAWMITNAEIRPDANMNYKPMKPNKSSTRHIDGVISSMMAFSLLNNPEINPALSVNKKIDYNILKALL